MPIIAGTLTDFGAVPLAAAQAEITFSPSGVAASNSGIFATRPVKVSPNNAGSFTVNLLATTLLRPDVWYTVRISWLDSDGGYVAIDFADWKVRVPPEGGNLQDLIDAPVRGGLVWIGPSAPDPTVFDTWVHSITADLYEWI